MNQKPLFCSVPTVLLFLAMLPHTAHADLVTYDFTVLVSSAGPFGNVSSSPVNVTAGIIAGTTQITGRFAYETNQIGTSYFSAAAIGEGLTYASRDLTLNFPATSVTIAGHESGSVYGVIVRNNVNYGLGLNDQFLYNNVTPSPANSTDANPGLRPTVTLAMYSAPVDTFASTDLPTSLELSDFSDNFFNFSYDLFGGFGAVGGYRVRGSLTSLTAVAVPEPTSFAFFTLLSVGIVGVKRFQKTTNLHLDP